MNLQRPYRYVLAVMVVGAVLVAPVSALAGSGEPGQCATMTRAQVYAEMEAMFGLVPTFIKSIPDSTLGLEWELMKRVQMEAGPIPNKYRELIGLAVSAATKCQYCAFFHTEAARLNGATDAEIEDALHYAKSTTGWSTYINGSQADLDTFKAEVKAMMEFAAKHSAPAAASSGK